MAACALLPQPAVVFVVFLMTGKTILWSPCIDIIDMAFLTGNVDMQPGQFENRKVVIKTGPIPFDRGMTGAAVRAQATLVIVVLLVTVETG